jgi:membrane associated rhomboid family serine protease
MFTNLPPVTKALLIANGLVFLLQQLLGDATFFPFMLWPLGDGGAGLTAGELFATQSFMPWQLLTYAFLHGNLMHVGFNMLALVMFGSPLEYTWGNRRFLAYYLVCVVGAGLCQLVVASWLSGRGLAYPTIGASGGVFGLLFAYGLLFPNQRVMLLIPPIPMKARTLVIVYGAIELLLGASGLQPGVAHFAHLGGMLFGWLLIRYWRGQPPFGRGGPRRPRIVR